MIRLQKFMADCGVCSRRKAENHILNKEIRVNDTIVSELGVKIDPRKDKVYFNGTLIKMPNKNIYLMLNKPEACITTADEQFNRETVYDYLDISTRVVPIGRLDYGTSGLLLFTNDGELVYKLTHPKHHIKKIYISKIFGTPSKQKIDRLRHGVSIDGYKTIPANVRLIDKDIKTSTLEIIITEGKNRQVRKMCESIGHRVVSLKRIAIDNLYLRDLDIGKYRYLTNDEIKHLKQL